MRTSLFLITFFASTLISTGWCQNATTADVILGKWFNQEKDANIEIFKEGKNYFGKIVWLKEPKAPNGAPLIDYNNPDSALRSKPIMNLVILKNFTFDGKNKWKEGSIYDPNNGKTYSCTMTLSETNSLNIRGFIGVALLGRTVKWTRIK